MVTRIIIFILIFITMLTPIGRKWEKNSLAQAVLYGLMESIAIFEIIVIPCTFLKFSFSEFVCIYAVIMLFDFAICLKRYGKEVVLTCKQKNTFTLKKFIILSLIVLQTSVLALGQHIDDDDASYIAEATTAIETDTISSVDPYTGELREGFNARYVLSPFPIFNAICSKLSGIHPAIMAHTVFPLIFIPLAYVVYVLMAQKLFPEEEQQQNFLLLLNFFHIFSYYSVYPASVFMLVRIWQGKAVLASIVLPLLFCQCLRIKDETMSGKTLLQMTVVLIVAVATSTMGIMLGAIMVGCFGVVSLFLFRNWKNTVYLGVSCIPNILAAVAYVFLR